jgi:glycosyltransferase involved in cell wall biosynthesis
MRVLIVYPDMYVRGGAELLIVRLANYLTKNNVENALLTTSILPEIEDELKGTRIILQPKSRSSIIGEALALHRGMRNNLNKYDIINVHNFPAEVALFTLRKPAVWMCNEPPEIALDIMHTSSTVLKLKKKMFAEFEKFVTRRYVRKAVVADDFNANRFEKIYGFKPEIIGYGIDCEFFLTGDKERAFEELGLQDNFVVLQVGMITPYKNQLESVKTLKRLKSTIPNVKLVLAGWADSEYAIMLGDYIKNEGLEEDVIFTGHVNREQVRDLYHACDVLLHPIKSQGGWLSPFEALCAERPVVVSPQMTASDIIRRERIGVVTEDYTSAIVDISRNVAKHHAMAKKGKEWVKDNLSWDRFCQQMVAVFNQVLSDNQ